MNWRLTRPVMDPLCARIWGSVTAVQSISKGSRVDFEDVQRDWTQLGKDDPLWAVLIMPGTKDRGWDPDEFLSTGRVEVESALTRLRTLGGPSTFDHVLDFGSGAGRLTQALAAHAVKVTGVDISAPMIETAKSLDKTDNCEFVLNTRPDLSLFADDTFDLVYSSLVLQHMPKDIGIVFLQEMCRVLRPGGALVIQVVSTPTLSFKGLAFRYAPPKALRWAQTRILKYPAPMHMQGVPDTVFKRIVAPSLDVLDSETDTSYGGHWVNRRHFAVKR